MHARLLYDFTERGIKQQHGFMAEHVVDEEIYMNPVPAELHDVAVLVESLTIAEKALIQIWSVQQRLPWSCAVQRVKLGPIAAVRSCSAPDRWAC